MQAAGVDTGAVVRALMVSLLEGALIYGVFHGDLHGGNLLVLPDGRVGLLDHGITGRLDERRRGTFLKMMLSSSGATTWRFCRLPGAGRPACRRRPRQVPREIPVDRPLVDPATADADQMLFEMRRVTKALVEHGPRLPKEVVLFMKDFMFLDASIATLAPDLNVVAEMLHLSQYFMERHGEQDLGRDQARPPTRSPWSTAACASSIGWLRPSRRPCLCTSPPTSATTPRGAPAGRARRRRGAPGAPLANRARPLVGQRATAGGSCKAGLQKSADPT